MYNKEQIENHQVFKTIENIRNMLKTKSKVFNNDDFSKWSFAIDFIEETIINIIPELLSSQNWNRLTQINNSLSNITTYLKQNSSLNAANISNGLVNISDLLIYFINYDSNSEKISKIIDNAYNRSKRHLGKLEKEVENQEVLLKELTNKLQELELKNKELESKNNDLINEFIKDFSTFKDDKNGAFDTFKDALRDKFDQIIKNGEDEIGNVLNDYQSEFSKNTKNYDTKIEKIAKEKEDKLNILYKEKERSFNQIIKKYTSESEKELTKNKANSESTLKEMNKMKDEVSSLVEIITNTGLASRYKQIAEKDNKYSFRMRAGSFAIMFIVAISTFCLFKDIKIESIGIFTLITKATFVTLFLLPAFYLSKIGAEYKKNADKALKMELELTALTPYLDSLPEEDAKKLKIELASKFFGNNLEEQEDDFFTKKDVKSMLTKLLENTTKK